MKKSIQVRDLETQVLPAGVEGATKIISIVAVPVIIVVLKNK